MTLHATFDQVIRTASALRVDLPDDIVGEYQRLADIYAKAGEAAPSIDEYRDAFMDCVANGGDPQTDPSVADMAARHSLSGPAVLGDLRAQAAQLLRDNAEEMFASFTECFDVAAGILRDNASSLGRVKNLSAEPDTPMFRQARYADAVMGRLLSLWGHLSMAGVGFPSPARRSLLVIADIPGKTWVKLRLDGVNMRPWQMAPLGLEFSLATPATFAERTKAVASARAEHLAGYPEKIKAERFVHRTRGRDAVDPLAYVP